MVQAFFLSLLLSGSAFADNEAAYTNLLTAFAKGPAQQVFQSFEVSFTAFGDLTENEIMIIQTAVDVFGHRVYVVGSAAKGRRRNAGTDLPIAEFGMPKLNTRSDIDYAVKTGLGERANELSLPDVDPSWGVREVDYVNLDSSPMIVFRPHQSPFSVKGSGRYIAAD